MAITKIKQVYGNVLRVAIPLTQRVRTMVDGAETEEEFDFYPSPDYPVMIDLYKGGGLHQTFTATMHDNVATFVDEGTIPIGVYQLEVRCRDMQGHPCRYMVRAIIIIVDATIDAGIEAGIEFNSETYTLEGTVFYYAKGDTGVGIERIEQITESEENGGVNVIRVTLTDGTYSDFNVRNGRLTPNQEERLAKIESDYVIWSFTRDGNTFNTDGYKYSDIVDIRNSGRVLHIRMINADGSGEERLFVDANEESNRFTAYYCEGKGEIAKSEIVGAKVYYLTRGDNDSINVTEINYESLLRPYLNSILYKGNEIANQAFVRDQNILVHFDIDDTITCDESVLNIIAALNANKRVLGEANLVNHTLFTPSYFADNIVVFDFISPIDGKRSTLFGVNNNNVDTWQLTEGQVYSKPNDGIPKEDLDANVQASLNKADNTYTRAQVDALINTAKQLTFVVVATLPTPSESTTGKIYLVPNSTPAQSNVRDEWITITVGGVYRWELIGSTAVDLTNYLTKDAFKDKTKVLKLVSTNPLQWESGHDALAKAMFNEISNFNRSNFDTDNIVPIFNIRNGYVYNLTHTRPRLNESNVRIGAKNVFYSINTTSTSRLIIDTDLSGNIVSISEEVDNSVDQKIDYAINYKTTYFSLQKHSDGSISFYDDSDLEVDFTYALSEIRWRRAVVYTNENLDPMGEGEQEPNQSLLFVYQKNERYGDSTYHTIVNFSQPSTFYRLTLLESNYDGEHTLELDDFEEVSFVQLMSNGKIDPYLLDDSTKASLALANSALQSETDPTVPSWAKQPTKPSYTAQEVGALPNTTTIPTSLSQLSEDTTHRTVSDTEKTTWNNKSNFSGNYNDLTNKPTIPTVPTNVSAFTNDAGYLTQHQDISSKADKVTNATNGDFAALDANGNLTNSGKKASDFQVALVNGVNIKTINGNSLLGEGNITIEGGGGSDDAVLYTAQTLTDGQKAQARANIDAYNMPNGGIPASDLDDDVQTTLTNVGVNANAIDELRDSYAALTQSDIVVVADHTAVVSPAANTIYREPGATSYADWMYYGGAWVKMAEYSNAIDDVPTEGSANLVKSGGVFDKVKALGDYWTVATAAQTLTGKYIQYTNGSIATASSTPTFTTIFVEIPTSADVDKVNIAIPKTTSTAGSIYGYANSLSATSVSGRQGRGNAGAQTIEVDVNHNYAYLVVCYNSAGGDPVVKFHTGLTDLSHFVKDSEISRELSGAYGIEDLRVGGEYINKTGGVASGYSNFKRSGYLPIYGSMKVVVSCAYTSTSATIVSFYDANQTWISGVLAATQNAQEYNVPVGAEYIVLSNKDNGAISLEFSSDGVAGFAGTLNNIADNITLPKRYVNILYVGNSFTANACAYIPTICNAVGAKDVNLNYIEVAGASLQTYVGYLSSGSLTTTISRGAKVAANGNLSSILAHDWDVIIFQQVSAQADDYSTYTPYLAQLVNAARKNCTNAGVKIAFGVVWGTYMSTYADIISAAKQMMANYDIDIVIPLGTAIENARGTSMAEGANSLSSDSNIQHLANGVGKYVAACALYTAVLAEFTGKGVYEDTTTTITTSGGLGEVDVTAENRALCQSCAVYAAIYNWAALDVESL